MATAASVTKDITDLTTCPICLELFDNPKSLPCLHAFCLKCLQEHFKDKNPSDEAQCPICRKEFQIPSHGVDGLQHNFFIQQLVDVRKASSRELDGEPCEVCLQDSREGSVRTATEFCFDCSQKLCDQCSKPHRWMKGGAHQVRHLGVELEEELIQLRASSCDKHKDKQVELYCCDCNENICLMCSAVKHRNHNSVEIPEVAANFKLRIEEDAKQIMCAVSSVHQQLEDTKQDAVDFGAEAENVKKTVIATGDEIKRLVDIVDKQVSDILMELESVRSASAKEAAIVRETLQLALVSMKSFHAYSRELLDKGRPSDITRATGELHDRATELLNSDVTAVKYRPPHVTFTPVDVTQVKRLSLIGQLVTTAGRPTVERVIQTLPEREPVCGVTSLDNRLYVFRDRASDQVEVYDIDSSQLLHSLTVPGLRGANDITACAYNRCAYICNTSQQSVHRVALPGPDAAVTQWPVGDQVAYLSISVRHGVLVSCDKVRKIKEFSTDGQLLQTVVLSQDVLSVWHAIQLCSGKYIVSHGEVDDPLHRVCLIGSDGQVVKSYGGVKGSGNQQMNVPLYLAVDRNGFVFVVDLNNSRVLLLSPALIYIREVVTREQLKWMPYRVHLDVDRHLLYIAVNEFKSGKGRAGRVVVVSV